MTFNMCSTHLGKPIEQRFYGYGRRDKPQALRRPYKYAANVFLYLLCLVKF